MRQAFHKYIAKEPQPNRSLLHYVLRRMGTNEDWTAVDYCAELLVTMPEETSDVVRYYESLGLSAPLEANLTAALKSRELAMYDYQRFFLLSCLWRTAVRLRSPTLKVIRNIAKSGDCAGYVRVAAQALLGKFGDQADIERLASAFSSATDPLERAQLLCCLGGLEKGRRSALLGRVRDEQPWVARAVKLLRAGST